MSNQEKGYTQGQRRSREMAQLLKETQEKINSGGYGSIKVIQIERLFVNYLRIHEVDKLLIGNFEGVQPQTIKPTVRRVMYGQACL